MQSIMASGIDSPLSGKELKKTKAADLRTSKDISVRVQRENNSQDFIQ